MTDFIDHFKTTSENLGKQFLSDGRVTTYLRGHTAAADECIRQLALCEELGNEIALVALGGYGRKELFPYSDLDVMVLLRQSASADEATKIEHFLMRLWDMGLTVGSSVRTLEETLRESSQDITVQTAILEARFICGNKHLFEELQQSFFRRNGSNRFR